MQLFQAFLVLPFSSVVAFIFSSCPLLSLRFTLLALFRLSQLPLRKGDLLALPQTMCCFLVQRTALRTHARRLPLLFFSRSSRWKPSAHGRDRSTCTDLHISRGLFENRSEVFVLSYIITFLRWIGIFMSQNEVVMDRILLLYFVFTMRRHIKFA